MIQHHLDEATLVRYASGDLDEAFAVAVASHVAMCESCQRSVLIAEEVGGQVLVASDAAHVSDGAFERLMRNIDRDDGEERHVLAAKPRLTPEPGDVPAPLRRFIGARLSGVSWKTVAPSVKKHTIKLSSAPSSSLYLLHILPGKKVPEHGHGGAELTLVLSGAYRDELGRFGPGDVADLDEHVEHQPHVEPGGPCICLVATEAPTRFKGLFSRLLQPLVGI